MCVRPRKLGDVHVLTLCEPLPWVVLGIGSSDVGYSTKLYARRHVHGTLVAHLIILRTSPALHAWDCTHHAPPVGALPTQSPGNPIVRRSIELSGEIRMAVHRLHGEASKRSTLTMGLTWTNAITLELFGLPRIKDDAEMAAARAAMAKVPALKSSAEGWCDGIWVQPYEGCRGVSRSSLYNEFKLAGWADTLNKKWTKKCDEVRRERSLLKDAKNPEAKKRMDKTMNRYECHDPNHAPPK